MFFFTNKEYQSKIETWKELEQKCERIASSFERKHTTIIIWKSSYRKQLLIPKIVYHTNIFRNRNIFLKNFKKNNPSIFKNTFRRVSETLIATEKKKGGLNAYHLKSKISLG